MLEFQQDPNTITETLNIYKKTCKIGNLVDYISNKLFSGWTWSSRVKVFEL